jgi:hypothetical protein
MKNLIERIISYKEPLLTQMIFVLNMTALLLFLMLIFSLFMIDIGSDQRIFVYMFSLFCATSLLYYAEYLSDEEN